VATKSNFKDSPVTKKPRHVGIEELEENATIEEQLLEPGSWEAKWKEQCEKEGATFWDRIALVPKFAQHELLIYLYRLDPRVFNKQGDPSYQAKYTLPLSIEQVQEDFGGGRYEIYLKRGRRTIAGKYTFSISGQPKYKEGQTDATGKPLATPSAPAAAESRGSDLSEALKAIVPLLKNDNGQKAAEASIEVMKTGMTTALGMQRDAAGAPNELLTKLVDRALTQPQGPDALALLDKIISISKNLIPTPAQNPNNLEGIDSQLGFVEKITGKSFSELLTPEGRAPKIDPWVGVLGALVQVIPSALREISQMQERRMQWQAHMASKGISLTAAPNLPANGQPPEEIPPPAPLTQPENQQPTIEQITAGMVDAIVRYRRGGWDGHACAAALAVNYAEVLPMLAQMLSDREQVEAFIVQTPALNVLVNEVMHPEVQSWSEFVDDFFWTLNPDQAPEDEEGHEDNEPETPEPADSTQPRTRKKKVATVGRVV